MLKDNLKETLNGLKYLHYKYNFKEFNKILIEDQLRELNIEFDKNIIFNKKKGRMYDFYLTELNIVVMYYGENHLTPFNFSKRSLHEFNNRAIKEESKRKFLSDNNIKLVPISFRRIENLRSYLISKIFNNKLPIY